MTWSGTRSQNSAIRSAGMKVPVGLFGLQTTSSCVAAVTSVSIASRSWT